MEHLDVALQHRPRSISRSGPAASEAASPRPAGRDFCFRVKAEAPTSPLVLESGSKVPLCRSPPEQEDSRPGERARQSRDSPPLSQAFHSGLERFYRTGAMDEGRASNLACQAKSGPLAEGEG